MVNSANGQNINILLIEDLQNDAYLEKEILRKSHLTCTIEWVSSRDEFLKTCSEFVPDIVITDYQLPDITVQEIMDFLASKFSYIPVIVISNIINEDATVDIMKYGAIDVLRKDHLFKLPQVVDRAIKESQKRKQLDETILKFAKTKELHDLIVENVPVGIVVATRNGEVVEINKQALKLLGYQHDNKPLHFSSKSFFVEDSQRVHFFKALFTKKMLQNFEAKIYRNDGSIRIFSFYAVLQLVDNQEYILTAFVDITEQKLLEEKVLFLSFFDPLTQLPNRNLLKDRIDLALMRARHNKRLVAVVTIDIDRFKYINDLMGYKSGDAILLQVSHKLTKTLRDGDVVARTGNDEFGIMLIDIARYEDIIAVVNKIRNIFELPMKVDNTELLITASMGIAIFPQDGKNAEELLQNADIALANARAKGRSICEFYTKDFNKKLIDFFNLEAKLKRAIERKEFEIYYQPYFNIRTQKIEGMEALLRWNNQGIIESPSVFIPILEDTGLIVDVGYWVIESVCQQLVQWHIKKVYNKTIAINISPIQFQRLDFKKSVVDILWATKVPVSKLIFEITESASMKNLEYTKEVIHELKNEGIRFAIDDFGIGYSSLNNLLVLPFDFLKIDRSFVNNVTTDPHSSILIRTINSMAHTIGLRTIAEGVETEEQLVMLKKLRCDFGQGYYFSKPLPANTVTMELQMS